MSVWRCAIALIASTAVWLAAVMAATLWLASTRVSTLIVGSLKSLAILLKSKSAKGFLKAVLEYMVAPGKTGRCSALLRCTTELYLGAPCSKSRTNCALHKKFTRPECLSLPED